MRTLSIFPLLVISGLIALNGCSRDEIHPSAPASMTAAADTLRHDESGCTPDLAPAAKATCSYSGKDHDLLTSGLRRIGLTLCRDHFAAGTPARLAVEAMLAHQNSIRGTSIRVYIDGMEAHTDYYGTVADDGVFKVDFVDPDDCDESDCSFSGRCSRRTDSSGGIDEFDLAFNDELDWDFGRPDSWDLDAADPQFRAVFLHELNHGFGFSHVLNATSDLSIMGGKTGKWVGQKHNGLKAFDFGHLRHHYPYGAEPAPDLVLSNYTTEWSDSKSNWQCALTEGLSRTWVVGSASVDVSYTWMNRGGGFSDGHTTKIFLSRDQGLDASDVLLSSIAHVTTGTFPAFATELKTRRITIPAGTMKGRYFVIIKVDASDAVAETKDTNNVLTIHESLLVASLVRIHES